VQMEAELVQAIQAMADEYDYSQHERAADCTLSGILCFEVSIKRVSCGSTNPYAGQPESN
jgi:hypothetical protein